MVTLRLTNKLWIIKDTTDRNDIFKNESCLAPIPAWSGQYIHTRTAMLAPHSCQMQPLCHSSSPIPNHIPPNPWHPIPTTSIWPTCPPLNPLASEYPQHPWLEEKQQWNHINGSWNIGAYRLKSPSWRIWKKKFCVLAIMWPSLHWILGQRSWEVKAVMMLSTSPIKCRLIYKNYGAQYAEWYGPDCWPFLKYGTENKQTLEYKNCLHAKHSIWMTLGLTSQVLVAETVQLGSSRHWNLQSKSLQDPAEGGKT